MFQDVGLFKPSPGQVRVVAKGTGEIASGRKNDAADLSGIVDQRLLLKTSEYHDRLPINEVVSRFYFATRCGCVFPRSVRLSDEGAEIGALSEGVVSVPVSEGLTWSSVL